MTTSSSIPSSNVCASTLNIKRQSIGSRRRSSSASSSARKSIVRDNLNRLYRFIVGGTANLRKNRFRQPTDCEIFDNDANIMALSCTAADEEIVPLSPNRAERIVCKNSLGVDHSTHPAHNEYLEQRAELLKGTYTAHTSHLLQPSTPPRPPPPTLTHKPPVSFLPLYFSMSPHFLNRITDDRIAYDLRHHCSIFHSFICTNLELST